MKWEWDFKEAPLPHLEGWLHVMEIQHISFIQPLLCWVTAVIGPYSQKRLELHLHNYLSPTGK